MIRRKTRPHLGGSRLGLGLGPWGPGESLMVIRCTKQKPGVLILLGTQTTTESLS